MSHYFLVSTNELFAQNIFMFWRTENDSVTIDNVIKRNNIDILMDYDLISYKVCHTDAYKKLNTCGYTHINKYHSQYPGIWYNGNIHKAYDCLVTTYNLYEQICSLQEELTQMRTAMKELEEYIFNLNAELLKSGITQK